MGRVATIARYSLSCVRTSMAAIKPNLAESGASSALQSLTPHDAIERAERMSHVRLQQQVCAYNRQARTNFLLGLVWTLLAVGLLAWICRVTGQGPENSGPLQRDLMRIGLGLLLETPGIALFRLYVLGIREIRFFHN